MAEKKSLKQEAAKEGAPIWIISFADMMSLLMSFMVAMVAMSELKTNTKLKEVVLSFQTAVGYRGGGWLARPSPAPAGMSFEEQVKQLIQAFKQQQRLKGNEGNTREPGIEGDRPSVTTIREGLQYVIGGAVCFESGRTQLLETARRQLDAFAEVVQGMNNKIRISGHTARIGPEQYAPFAGLGDLAYARAKAVKEYLISRGIREERMTVESCADHEPLAGQAYDATSRARNDRVALVVTESLVEDYQGEPASSRPTLLDEGS